MIDPRTFGCITDTANGETWRPARLAREVARRAAVLAPLLGPERRTVIIAHGGRPAFFADLLAVWRLGGTAACIDPHLTADEVATLVRFTGACAVLVAEGATTPAASARNLDARVIATPAEPEPTHAPDRLPANFDDPALILFTSGTTGAPKGVVHSLRGLLARTALNRAHIGYRTLARTLCLLPTHFGHGLIGNCLTPLLAGGHLFLAPPPDLRAAAGLGALIDAQRIRFMSSVPTLWKMALKLGPPPGGATLKRVHVGSAPLSAALWRDIMTWAGTADVVNMYGITETANWAAGASARRRDPEDGLIGTMWGGRAAVIGDDGDLMGAGEGEIALLTPALMLGYHRRPDLTDAVLRAGWYRTGDVGRIDRHGVIRLTGRQRDEINRAGIKIQPAEVDMLLERHADVVEACTFAIDDALSGEIVAVAVTLAEGARVDTVALRAWCARHIRREAVPERWFVLADIPKTERGKIRRDIVRQRCLEAGS